MKTTSRAEARRLGTTASTARLLLGVFLLGLTGGCGAVEEEGGTPPPEVGTTIQDLDEENGLTTNGLTFNGLAFNGLAFNGLAFNGLNNSAFSMWFQQSPLVSSLFMKYLVRCALPPGQSRTYWDGNFSYTWPGSLGLAPGWTSGAPATLAEQQSVSACLAALTNMYGRTVGISVLGTSAQGQLISYTSSELAEYSLREGCFFGNLFNGEGLFVGNDQGLLSPSQSSLRACALKSNASCAPLTHIGSCQASCQLDPTGTYFTQCTHNGVTYRAMTTRLHPQEIFTCGDGICQPTESCGSGNRYDDCKLDCGSCN